MSKWIGSVLSGLNANYDRQLWTRGFAEAYQKFLNHLKAEVFIATATGVTTFCLSDGTVISRLFQALILPAVATWVYLFILLLWSVGALPARLHAEQAALIEKLREKIGPPDLTVAPHCWPNGNVIETVLMVTATADRAWFEAFCTIRQMNVFRNGNPATFINQRYQLTWKPVGGPTSNQVGRHKDGEIRIATAQKRSGSDGYYLDLYREGGGFVDEVHIRDQWTGDADPIRWLLEIEIIQIEPEIVEKKRLFYWLTVHTDNGLDLQLKPSTALLSVAAASGQT
jgi:hypothetical protein